VQSLFFTRQNPSHPQNLSRQTPPSHAHNRCPLSASPFLDAYPLRLSLDCLSPSPSASPPLRLFRFSLRALRLSPSRSPTTRPSAVALPFFFILPIFSERRHTDYVSLSHLLRKLSEKCKGALHNLSMANQRGEKAWVLTFFIPRGSRYVLDRSVFFFFILASFLYLMI
jgi:hypothetical protein